MGLISRAWTSLAPPGVALRNSRPTALRSMSAINTKRALIHTSFGLDPAPSPR
jgi:hypothetical protein